MMRIAIIAAIAAIGLGCIGMSGASAAPVSGTVIKDSAAASSLTQNVWWRHRHCWWRHGYRHCD
jgi:hypothetical protein